MTPSTDNAAVVSANPNERPIQKTVFDLGKFDTVLLGKTFILPPAPKSLDEALVAVGRDEKRLLAVIADGLETEARRLATSEETGWNELDEEKNIVGPYTGVSANEEVGKKINNAVLSMAKTLGYSKDLSKEKRAALKDEAMEFIKSNPRIVESIKAQASASPASATTDQPAV